MEIEDPAVVATSGKTHHPIVRFTGRESDVVKGTAFEVTAEGLQSADSYEVSDYMRVSVTLLSESALGCMSMPAMQHHLSGRAEDSLAPWLSIASAKKSRA